MIPILLTFSDIGILIVRIIAGSIFASHGFPKLKDPDGTATFFESHGLKPGKPLALFVGLLEVVGGIMLVLGFFTQPFAFLFIIEMLVAAIVVNRKKGLVGGYELDLAMMALCIVLVVVGAGDFSVDNFFRFFVF